MGGKRYNLTVESSFDGVENFRIRGTTIPAFVERRSATLSHGTESFAFERTSWYDGCGALQTETVSTGGLPGREDVRLTLVDSSRCELVEASTDLPGWTVGDVWIVECEDWETLTYHSSTTESGQIPYTASHHIERSIVVSSVAGDLEVLEVQGTTTYWNGFVATSTALMATDLCGLAVHMRWDTGELRLTDVACRAAGVDTYLQASPTPSGLP